MGPHPAHPGQVLRQCGSWTFTSLEHSWEESRGSGPHKFPRELGATRVGWHPVQGLPFSTSTHTQLGDPVH